LLYDAILSLLELRHLLTHKLVKHLLFKTVWRDGEVEDGHLHGGLWRVVRVWQRSCHEELEVLVVGDGLVS
jgi:hypothetical protein